MAHTKKHEKYNVCRYCDKLYEVGFFGTGSAYCSRHCALQSNKIIQRERCQIKTDAVRRAKECILCHRNIIGVGKRKRPSKFCSARCMFTYSRMRSRKDKSIRIKVPIKDLLDGSVKIELNGKVNIGGKLIGVYDG